MQGHGRWKAHGAGERGGLCFPSGTGVSETQTPGPGRGHVCMAVGVSLGECTCFCMYVGVCLPVWLHLGA